MSDGIDFGFDRGESPDDLADKFERFDKVVEENLKEAMTTVVLKIEADAKRKSPIDTGTLRSSIRGVVLGWVGETLQGVVGTNVEYAPYQEFGTRHMEANEYLQPALDENKDWAFEQFEQAVEKAEQQVFG